MSADRSPGVELGFAARAANAFAFLEHRGFQATESKDQLVRFESARVFVSVYQGRSSFNVDLELGRVDERELYTLQEVLQHLAPDRINDIRCQATTIKVLERCLDAMASVLAEECHELLDGDDDVYERLGASAAQSRHDATVQAQYGAVLDRADRAWEQNERDRAAELYESAEQALDETRGRRLAYVRGRRS